jgi:7-cyano-7-deazaguanine synthase
MIGEKAVVIFSGGMDSITLLNYVKSLGYGVYGLSFNYGQKHVKELVFAKLWGQLECEEHKIINLDFMKDIANDSALTGNKEMPKEHYTHENQKVTVVPNRNMVMLSIAVAWAENLKTDKVFYGPHANDLTIYPDCRPVFVEAVSKASELATFSEVKIFAPFVNITKSQIVALGTKLGVDYSKTWSCYEGRDRACGKCGTCQERIEAFKENELIDPSPYEVVSY